VTLRSWILPCYSGILSWDLEERQRSRREWLTSEAARLAKNLWDLFTWSLVHLINSFCFLTDYMFYIPEKDMIAVKRNKIDPTHPFIDSAIVFVWISALPTSASSSLQERGISPV
jgi:hypothetical protein